MPRYPDELLERLKSEVSLERLLTSQGHELKKHGKDLITRCPFHDDRTPSLVISPKTNLWHCMGACQMGGSVIDWVMKRDGVSFRHAVELLKADLLHLNDTDTNASTKLPPLAAHPNPQQQLREIVEYYHQTLTQSPAALAYLEKRGLQNSELVTQFKLGYAETVRTE